MTNAFIKGFDSEGNKTLTENHANAFKSTTDSLLDLFATAGSLRCRGVEDIISKFSAAYDENPLLAMKMAFYIRNVRGGLGERRTFRIIINWLAKEYPRQLLLNLELIPHYGRWDDLYSLLDTPLEEEVWFLINRQLNDDITILETSDAPVSLMAKWLKSANASSQETRELGRRTAKALDLSPRTYRQILSALRKRINIVEAKMSENEWEQIEFSTVPSRAMSIYRNAFELHTPDKFHDFISAVEQGTEKINADTLYPYDILEKAHFRDEYDGASDGWKFKINADDVLEAQWKALPDFIEEPANFVVMADTSGSMFGRPLTTSISLALYFAERNTGVFKDRFMTFSSRPQFVTLKGSSLEERIKQIEAIHDNTDLEAAFESVLRMAVENKVPKEEMPKSFIVISDGEIDRFTEGKSSWSFLGVMGEKYAAEGYSLPKVVMWNVESRADRFIDTIDNPNVQFISGSSPSSFKALISGQNFTALELMKQTLNDKMYAGIKI